MTTNKQKSSNETMVASSTDVAHEKTRRPHRFILTDTDHLSIPNEEDEADLDEIIAYKNPEKKSPPPPLILTTNPSTPIRPWSDLSIATGTIPMKKFSSRLYKFVQLEQAFKSANLINNPNDQTKFEHEYRTSLRENKFEEFLQTSYQKLRAHKETIRQERAIEASRKFTFVDLEKNFLALYPTRHIKIVFIDQPTTSSTSDMPNIRPGTSIHRNSRLSIQSNDDAVEAFYENRSTSMLRNPSRARDEITLFARQAAKNLHESLPCLSCVPYRVRIVDERDKQEHINERTLLQMKHKHTLSLISKRRQLVMRMMTQTQKNQKKMKQLDRRPRLTMDNLFYCRELLERVNQIEQTLKQEQLKHPQTDMTSRKTTHSSYQTTTTTTINKSPTPSYSSYSTPFQDALSMYHVEKTNNVHIIQPKQPLAVPLKKVTWLNYC